MRKTSSFVYALLAASLLLLTACPGPEPPEPTPPIDASANGIYVLNEGTMDHNNSSISYYDILKPGSYPWGDGLHQLALRL